MRWLVLLLALPTAAAGPLLVAVVPYEDGFAVGCAQACDLTGWSASDGESAWAFPAGTTLPDGGRLWAVGNLTRWADLQGEAPAVAATLRLGNSGDDLALLDPAGATVDRMAWDAASPGLVLGKEPTPRLHKVGESRLDRPTFQVPWLTAYASPDSSFQVLTGLVAGATQRLHLHVYELRSAALVDALVAAKAAHPALDLQVLVDADPVGASAADRHATADALRRIQLAGGRAVLAGNGRYDDHHLKVLVADGAVAVQSENWVEAGVPQDPSWGNRGWGLVVHDAAAADWFASWMQADRDAWDAQDFDLAAYDPSFHAPGRAAPRAGDYGPIVPATELHGDFRVTPVVAPDESQVLATAAIAAVAAAARRRLDVQQLDLSLSGHNSLGWSGGDPLADAIAMAAAHGANVRVQAAAPFSADDTGNAEALAWLAQRGAATGTMERAGIATLHNKGIVADDAVVVGSLNGNLHSRAQNREVDLVVQGAAVADAFDRLFSSDWSPAPSPRDWGAPARDLHALPPAPGPILLALVGVVAAGRRRWS